MTTKAELSEHAAEAVGAMLLRFQSRSGMPLDVLLAGAHAQIVSMMLTTHGAETAAECCEQVAARLRSLPSLADAEVAGRC
ncbi:hypothetical protein [Histidinibacterium lentulum]|uniref:Uncharacterized protein n=1 Tax=Histidinibacterium lentulum TaxID=2480588 RepID=A0A3N2QV19_9RHOB|nr:hypothetical protein [Histidinibacterium lentulum]ROT99071.1 hypothetical protein EAT49_15760 [Histidinibacterium lentulum]